MTLEEFRRTLSRRAPPAKASPSLAALWWAAKGNWDKAHAIAMEAGGKDAAWVHAYLHRVEGDLDNARYWYRQAGREPAISTLPAEWDEIASALL